jgi:hypothetical protein
MRIPVEPWSDCFIALLAAASREGFKVSPVYYYAGLAILVVLMLIAFLKAYRMWEEIHDVEEPDSPTDLLEAFEEAHAAGELDDEEFERVRRRLTGPPADLGPAKPAEPGVKNLEES